MGKVRRFELPCFFRTQLQFKSGESVFQVGKFGGADDGSGDNRFRKQPGQRYACRTHSAILSDLSYGVDDLLIARLIVQFSGNVVAFGSPRGCGVIRRSSRARQQPTGQR